MYKYLLFDADETLLDFKAGERAALRETLSSFPLECSEEVYRTYHEINDEEWKKLERGETTRERLRVERFARLYRTFGLDGEELGEKTADIYVEKLSAQSAVFDDVLDTVSYLSKKYSLYIITNGITQVQKKRFAATPLPPYFKKLYISQEMGCAKPEKTFFDKVVTDIGDSDRGKYLVIGDSLTSDIAGAAVAGIDACFLNRGKDGRKSDTAAYNICGLSELKEIL